MSSAGPLTLTRWSLTRKTIYIITLGAVGLLNIWILRSNSLSHGTKRDSVSNISQSYCDSIVGWRMAATTLVGRTSRINLSNHYAYTWKYVILCVNYTWKTHNFKHEFLLSIKKKITKLWRPNAQPGDYSKECCLLNVCQKSRSQVSSSHTQMETMWGDG